MKDNSQPKTPHPDEIQALAQILVLNKDRESWVVAKQKNTGPLPTKPSFWFQLLLKQWPNQHLQIPSGNHPNSKIYIAWGKKNPNHKIK